MIDYFYPPQPIRLWPNSDYFLQLDKNPVWDAEIKYNGWRLLVFIEGNIIKLYNRHGTIIDIDPKQFYDHFKSVPSGTVFDAELLNFRTTTLKNAIVIFDTVYYHGKDLRQLPLTERRKYQDHFLTTPSTISLSQQPRVFKIQQFSSNFINLYNSIIIKNNPIEEGLVLKRKNSIYHSHVKKGINVSDWIKVKKIDDSAKVDRNK